MRLASLALIVLGIIGLKLALINYRAAVPK